MSRQATMVRLNLTRGRPLAPPEPVFPWRIHRFNPRPAPLEPITDQLKGDPYNMAGAMPVMWPTQCRDCWGWVDDPRHS